MDVQAILKQYWGYDSFRPLQEEIIRSALDGKDTLALLPTGGGKSVCFQVPAMAKEGMCLVISPLIALMKDQVEQLQDKNIRALSITSGMSKREVDIALDNAIYGQYKFLYLSPERLLSPLVQERIKKMPLNLIAVDEAHCISQWGYDFRPAYLEIAAIRELHPDVPILALTATATQRVQDDIQERLRFPKKNILKKSFERKNLAYVVLNQENKLQKLLEICNQVKGTGLVYVRNRRETQEVAAWLHQQGLSADFYHAGMDLSQRAARQNAWMKGALRVVVATNAFGMGIDKPDVRFVVHLDLPESPEAYYQEAGRAGRDEQKAYAVLLYTENDRLQLQERLEKAFPSVQEISDTYQALGNHYQVATGAGEGIPLDFSIDTFCKQQNLSAITVLNSLRFLEHDGYVAVSEAVFMPARLMIVVSKERLGTFVDNHPEQKTLITALLRSHGGLFDGFTKISESDLARKSDLSKTAVEEHLQYLHQQEIIQYLPQKELPQLQFLRPRIAVKDLQIDTRYLAQRKKILEEQIAAMLAYATETTCRSVQLLAYFGEKGTACGVCDVCLAKKQAKLDPSVEEQVWQQVQVILSEPKQLKEVVLALKGIPEQLKLDVLQKLLDEGKLIQEENRIRILHTA